MRLFLLLIACAHQPASRPLHRETTVTMPSGATLLAAEGWWVGGSAGALVLEDPDRAVKLFLVESREPDGEKAIAEAWARIRPGFALPILHADRPPPTGGWDAHTEVEYRSEKRAVQASARRFRGISYVALLDGDPAATDRRQAQLDTTLESLRPRGMRDESFAGRSPRALDAPALDAFIEMARLQLGVPGAAVAVVAHGKVVYQKSFGVRALGRKEPVSERTLFLLASITKPMTTLMQASLVDAGILGWSTPVTQLLPWFALGDAGVTRRLQLWHMSCACTGMPRQDLEDLFEYDGVTPEQRLASMKTMTPTTGFGETFQYSNLLLAAGGFAAAHAFAPHRPLADAYAAAMKEKLFDPIGMPSTTLDFAAVERADHAEPHALDIDGVAHPIPLAEERDVLPIAPAGGVWTNLVDFERYVVTELEGGVAPGGRRVVSEANLSERRRMRVRDGASGGYGLGLGVSRYHDLEVFSHAGGSFGFGTTMFMIPEHHLGILVLTNIRNGDGFEQLPFNSAVNRRVMEALFDARPLAEASVDYYAQRQRRAATRGAHLDRKPDAALAGRYTNPDLGRVDVSEGAVFDAGEWKSRFARRVEADGTVKLILLDPPLAGGELTVGDGTLTAVYGQKSYVFRR